MKTTFINVLLTSGILMSAFGSEAGTRFREHPPILQAAEVQVGGTVTGEEGLPLPGVNIIEKGTTNGTTTDADGRFSLQVDDDATLVFSFIGYLTQEVAVNNQTAINVFLQPDTQTLQEVVVVGYGTQRKVNLTGSVTVVDDKVLESRPITNATQALQGVQGLYVNQAGGQPGSDEATIRIRGVGSIGGSSKLDPLVMVNGVEYNLSDVNPNDIESISVLKDAASTSIYGSRAANGVILITTKSGKAGRSSIEYNNYFGFQEATYLPDPVDNSADFLEAYNTAMVNGDRPLYYADTLIASFRNKPTSDIYPNTNWMDLMFNRASIQEHNLRFSGGSEKTTYSLSVGYLDQEGVLMGTSAKKYSANLRVGSQLTKRLSIDGSIIGAFWDVEDNLSGISTAMNRLMRMVPIQPTGRFEDGRWPDSWVLTPGQNSFDNPLIRATQGFRNEKRNNLIGSLSLKYNIIEGLNYEVRTAYNLSDQVLEQFTPQIWLHNARTGLRTRPWSSTSTRLSSFSRSPQLTVFNTLTFNKKLGEDHVITALAGTSFERRRSMNFDAQVQGFPSNDLPELDIGTTNPSVGGNSSASALLSYFGRVQYAFRERYLFETNFRYDASSRFHRDHRWGFFPSLSLGWRMSEESFLQNTNWLDELKLRVSWGQIGNQEIGFFQYVNAVSLGANYAFGGVIAPGAAITQSRDPQVSWETSTSTNFGLDWSILEGKLSGVIDVFRKRTDGILRTVNLPAQVGDLAGPTTNVAVVDNSGFELSLLHQNQISQSLSYEIGAHLTKIRNEVVDTDGEIIFSGNTITQEGAAINSWYVYETDGLFQTQADVDSHPIISSRVGPGDIKYVDRDGNGTINGDDRYVAGNSFPDFTYGFNVGITFKGVQLSTIWQGVLGIDVYPDFNMASPFYNGAGLEKRWLTDAWTPENPNAELPRLTSRNLYTENFQVSDFWLQDASYLRLKNIQLSYPFQGGLLEKISVQQLKIFVNAQNLLTFSKFKQYDPERNIQQTNLSEYPSVKMFTMGLNVRL